MQSSSFWTHIVRMSRQILFNMINEFISICSECSVCECVRVCIIILILQLLRYHNTHSVTLVRNTHTFAPAHYRPLSVARIYIFCLHKYTSIQINTTSNYNIETVRIIRIVIASQSTHSSAHRRHRTAFGRMQIACVSAAAAVAVAADVVAAVRRQLLRTDAAVGRRSVGQQILLAAVVARRRRSIVAVQWRFQSHHVRTAFAAADKVHVSVGTRWRHGVVVAAGVATAAGAIQRRRTDRRHAHAIAAGRRQRCRRRQRRIGGAHRVVRQAHVALMVGQRIGDAIAGAERRRASGSDGRSKTLSCLWLCVFVLRLGCVTSKMK